MQCLRVLSSVQLGLRVLCSHFLPCGTSSVAREYSSFTVNVRTSVSFFIFGVLECQCHVNISLLIKCFIFSKWQKFYDRLENMHYGCDDYELQKQDSFLEFSYSMIEITKRKQNQNETNVLREF